MNTFFDHQILVFFLVFARCFALIETIPFTSSAMAVPFTGRAGLAFFTAMVVAPVVIGRGYPIGFANLDFVFLLGIEIMIGIIIGFFVSIVFAIMHSAGQFFSLQMGLAAGEMFDPMTSTEIPVMAQFLNIMAFFLFFSVFGLQKIFFIGIQSSFSTVIAPNIIWNPQVLSTFLTRSVMFLFGNALMIAMPLISTLSIVSVVMGLLGKAAPQMNLMMLGFPIQLSVGFLILIFALPNILNAFLEIIDIMWEQLVFLLNIFKTKI